jgi:hypothetical protein
MIAGQFQVNYRGIPGHSGPFPGHFQVNSIRVLVNYYIIFYLKKIIYAYYAISIDLTRH